MPAAPRRTVLTPFLCPFHALSAPFPFHPHSRSHSSVSCKVAYVLPLSRPFCRSSQCSPAAAPFHGIVGRPPCLPAAPPSVLPLFDITYSRCRLSAAGRETHHLYLTSISQESSIPDITYRRCRTGNRRGQKHRLYLMLSIPNRHHLYLMPMPREFLISDTTYS